MIIAEIIETKERVALIGSGYGLYASATPDILLGNWKPDRETGSLPIIAVCDKSGNIGWIPSDQIKIIEIEGIQVSDLNIDDKVELREIKAKCSRCGRMLELGKRICSNCKYEN